jgi:hypothetical protein
MRLPGVKHHRLLLPSTLKVRTSAADHFRVGKRFERVVDLTQMLEAKQQVAELFLQTRWPS